MSEYFILKEDQQLDGTFKPPRFENGKPFAQLPAISVVDVAAQGDVEVLDWLERPIRMVSDKIKTIATKYNARIAFKRVYFMNREQQFQPLYWAMQVPAIDALSSQSSFHPDQTIKRLVLARSKIAGHHMFTIAGVREPYLVLSLAAAESLLRREATGFVLNRVEVHEEGQHEALYG
ncbi:hypothetical protein SAMN04487969_12947 [Paenibacillus algorifonticola]|uniref:Uncharacterized protein n=1 Tax=Paenibacillus algorifonticola TaxID=684063 RepID=A0A1I2I2N9_9BACL|nr:hypothetical protein [Paenibacillus algorifonticola]SFF35928.1 hypothetical protein SAMN04487969_12947 [Paenibacillus algorifonticola]